MSTILVIDDEKGILQIIYQALTRFGHNVETAGTVRKESINLMMEILTS